MAAENPHPPPSAASPAAIPSEESELSRQYDTPMGLAHTTMQTLKDRIKLHYDLASDYYLSLWGEHIHHGYWPTDESKATETKEVAQTNMVRLLVDMARVSPDSAMPVSVLDVGCGIGGTARHLASRLGCSVTGITISTRQVEIATRLSLADAVKEGRLESKDAELEDGFIPLGRGRVKFLELDAEKMGEYFADAAGTFDVVWNNEFLNHFPDKALFFRNSHRVLKPGGTMAFADWAKAEGLTDEQFRNDIRPIEDGMLLPPLCTLPEYMDPATEAGFKVLEGPNDISADVAKTWDITWGLIQNPSLWAFALSQGRDGIAFLQAFRAMRRGYANGTFRYIAMSLQK